MTALSAEASIAQVLTEDHDLLDALFARAFDHDDAEALAELDLRLRAHMKLEEELIFPALPDTLAAPLAVMKREHDHLRELLDENDLELLATCLGSHNVKEERIIYPACEGPPFVSLLPRIRAALERASK